MKIDVYTNDSAYHGNINWLRARLILRFSRTIRFRGLAGGYVIIPRSAVIGVVVR